MRFDESVELLGALQTLGVAGGAEVLGHAVNGEGLRVNLFAIGNRVAEIIDRPINAAVFRIPELIDDVTPRAIGHFAVSRVDQPASRRISP